VLVPGADIYAAADRVAQQRGGHYMDQFTNAERVTDWRGNNNIAESLFAQMSREPHPVPAWVVVGAGTGGTSATLGRWVRYRPRYAATRIAVADPEFSVFHAYHRDGDASIRGARGSRIEGIGVERPYYSPYSAKKKDDDGWFPTRDRGWIDDDGFLFIEGRSDDTIIRGGENIAPAEIEDVLLHHPDVADAAVVGVPDDEWGQRIEAAVVLREGATTDTEALRAHCREHLRSSKTPDRIVVRDALPHTDTGKLLRRAVLADLSAEAAPTTGQEPG
jgi:acyl-CoA synthetase (AMP-forming)/AMP-acid ligase II